jgi:hypothetical protein
MAAAGGASMKGKLGGVAQAKGDHLEDDLGQVGALDLRQGEVRGTEKSSSL